MSTQPASDVAQPLTGDYELYVSDWDAAAVDIEFEDGYSTDHGDFVDVEELLGASPRTGGARSPLDVVSLRFPSDG